MDRIINADGTPVYASVALLPFPSFAKPVPGGWDVTVQLTSLTGGVADIIVLQGGKQLKATTASGPGTYTIHLDSEDLKGVSEGACSISDMAVLIRGAIVGCCDGYTLPDTLTFSMSSSCAPANGVSVSLNRTGPFEWQGSWGDPTGAGWFFLLTCGIDGGVARWIFSVGISEHCGNLGEYVRLLDCEPITIDVPQITMYYCSPGAACSGNIAVWGEITA